MPDTAPGVRAASLAPMPVRVQAREPAYPNPGHARPMQMSAPAGQGPLSVADPQIAAIFRQMRAILGLSVPGLARRLGTDIAVVMELEAGSVENLPPWPETVRIIEGYGALTGVDQGPLVARVLMLQTPTTQPPPAPLPAQPAPRLAPSGREIAPITQPPPYQDPRVSHYAVPAPRAREQQAFVEAELGEAGPDAAPARRRRFALPRPSGRVLMWLGLPIGAMVSVALVANMAPQMLYSTVEAMPFAVRAPLRPTLDYIVTRTSPVRDGLRWVETVNPRSRKSDRLPSTVR